MTTSDLGQFSHRVRLALDGELDVATASDALARVIDALPARGDLLTLDLRDVTFLDSSGISMLIKASDYLEGMGCHLSLANPSDPVIRVLTMVGLGEHFPIDIDDASQPSSAADDSRVGTTAIGRVAIGE